ncbi:metal dependent phosphohydrolase [Chondrocystis sp. NIES-4102]|nr:metal dependent phosphohydrolase [Chondrocystis sp. NIES-4102]
MRDRVISWLQENVSQQRLQHILGVEQTCISLAHHYQVDPKVAAQAGLMHDLAKFFSTRKLLKIATEAKIPIDDICYHHPHLLHAEVGAVVAQQEFGINDPDILNAISNHTLGTPYMSVLSCIVFIADALEPNRGNDAELIAMRVVAQENLYKCVQQTSDYSLKYLVSQQKVIHPRSILTRNWALAKIKQN